MEEIMHSKILTITSIPLAIILITIACENGTDPSSQASIPVLTTAEISGITSSSAITGGNITIDGGAEVTARGVCWSTNSNPSITDNFTTDGAGTGSFISAILGLTENTPYNARAYATNSAGTGYGSSVTFSTLSINNQLEYLGQTPPGLQFVRFAPNIIPVEMIHSVTVSLDGQEIYWPERSGIKFTKIENGQWTTPQYVSFSGGNGDFYDDAPVVSPDNTKLFFNSRRPNPYTPGPGFNFWFCERTESGWSEPQPLPEVICSTGGIHWQVSISNSGTLYFGIFSGASAGIYDSRFVDGEYTTPEPLSILNNFGHAICPFIAVDESYIIFNKIENGMSVGYYISFKGSDNQWLAPQRLNQFPGEESSFVTRDGRYIFCKAFWASAQIIEDLRPVN